MRKTILVTGGAGFIGSHICKKLLLQNNEVLCCDNLSTGSKDNIRSLQEFSSFEFIRHDINFPLYVDVDEIYNLACPASPQHYQKDPVQTVKTNTHGLINILGIAKRTKAKVFHASTSEVYGDPEVSPQREDYWGNVNPIGLRACYDEGKRCAETLCYCYQKQHNLDIRIGRIFNTYGPNMTIDDGRVVSNFIKQALQNKNISIYGNGKQTRSFCFVSDTVECITKFMNNKEKINTPLNIGNSNETIKIYDLANKIIQLTNSKSNIIYYPIPEDDPKNRKPDSTLVKQTLDWFPKISLEEGLKETINYFKDWIK